MNQKQMPPTLAELQRWMRWVITEPRGAATALEDRQPSREEYGDAYAERFSAPDPDCLPYVASEHNLSATNRIEVYAEAYFLRLHAALGDENFATVKKAVGGELFKNLTAQYLAFYPSRFWNIEDVGSGFPAFVAAADLPGDFPFLHCLSLLEYQLVKSFFADSQAACGAEKLSVVSDWQNARFEFAKHAAALQLEWSIFEMWSARADDGKLPRPEQSTQFLQVHRNQEHLVEVDVISSFKYQLLVSLRNGERLSEAISALPDEAEEEVSANLQEWFREWMQSGMIVDIFQD